MIYRSKQGFIGISMVILVIFMVGALSMMILTHTNVNRHLETAKWTKGLRLDAESLENFTTSAIYEFRESNPSAYGSTMNVLDELIADTDLVTGFAEESGSIASITHNSSVPVNQFYPEFQGAAFLDYDESQFDLPRHIESLLNAGPVAYLGNDVFTYTLSYPDRTSSFDRDIDVTAHCFLVPITNFPVVLYGLPFTGEIQDQTSDYSWINSTINTPAFRSAGGRVLLSSVVSPLSEEGITNTFFDPNKVYIPRMYQPHARMTWTLYELIKSTTWRNNFLVAAGQATIDMAAWDTITCTGVTVISETNIIVDADAVVASVLNIIPSRTLQITISGSPDSAKAPFSIVVHNEDNQGGLIYFSSNNLRPIMVLNDGLRVSLGGNITVRGALFMNSRNNPGQARITGTNSTILGHLSLDSWGELAENYELSSSGVTVLPDLGVRDALAEFAPCAYIVGTTSSF